MFMPLRWLVPVLCLGVIVGASDDARAQADPQGYLFNSGQSIQPVFEGWAHNPNGSFEMHFGYLNRNYVEELEVSVGADNRVEPAGPDRGQPTYFYPRVNRRMFSVTVPADWGDRELVWTVTVRDETYRAVGWLQAEWEIAANPGARVAAATEGEATNEAPTLVVDVARTVTLADTLTMTATVTDDGLPEPRAGRRARVVLPTFERNADGPTVPVNVPQLLPASRHRPTRTKVEQVNVTWSQRRGPIGVTLESQDEDEPEDDSEGDSQDVSEDRPRDVMTTVTASFETPGEYVFLVQASDGAETVTEQVAVTVR